MDDRLQRLDRERENVHAALAWARETDAEIALRLSAALWRCGYAHGELRKGRQWLSLALVQGGAATAVRAQALLGRGALEWALGDSRAAGAALIEAASIAESSGDGSILPAIYNVRGLVAQAEGDGRAAGTLLARALELARGYGRTRVAAAALHNLGLLAAEMGDLAQAGAFVEESRMTRRSVGLVAAGGSEPAMRDPAGEDWRALRQDHDAALGLVTLKRS